MNVTTFGELSLSPIGVPQERVTRCFTLLQKNKQSVGQQMVARCAKWRWEFRNILL